MRNSIAARHLHSQISDEELLRCTDPETIGVFYASSAWRAGVFRSPGPGLGYGGGSGCGDVASALVARRRFVARDTPAVGWLYTIAARRFVDFQRRQAVAQRTHEAAVAAAAAAERLAALWSPAVAEELDAGLLRHLPHGNVPPSWPTCSTNADTARPPHD